MDNTLNHAEVSRAFALVGLSVGKFLGKIVADSICEAPSQQVYLGNAQEIASHFGITDRCVRQWMEEPGFPQPRNGEWMSTDIADFCRRANKRCRL